VTFIRLSAIGGIVAAAMVMVAGVSYSVGIRKDTNQALLDIKAHGGLEGHSDTVPRLATIEAVLRSLADDMRMLQESQTRTEARVYDLQVRFGSRRNELVEPF
jgi:ABC-type lipoprotein release transport system permease subunit